MPVTEMRICNFNSNSNYSKAKLFTNADTDFNCGRPTNV